MQDNNKNNDAEKSSSSRKWVRIILIIVAVLMIVFGSAYYGFYLYNQYNANSNDSSISSFESSTKSKDDSQKLVNNPIDFESLQEKNDEVYAWIKVPDTKVNYPICQSKKDDAFYLRHSAIDKSYLSSGAIYTEFINTKTFKDRVTVIYGHNGYKNASMFTSLHQFENEEFFNSHPYFYIYTPNSVLTYQIVSAFKYDNRHIMNSFNFVENAVFEDFINMIQNPSSSSKNVRQELDKSITLNDNIVVLSTCITNQKSSRYLVCGVLVKNEKTN